MLTELRFVQGGVARKDFVQALQHFRIQNKTIKGFNGMIGLCTPINLDLDITPKADQFAKAVATCKDTIGLNITSKGKLNIKSGQFKAIVDCIPPESYPEITPEGEFVELTSPILPAIKTLAPFIADDASRTWARGILIRGSSAYATNNIVIVEAWLGAEFPVCVNIPKDAVNELLRINEEPVRLQVTENRITFHFSGDRWLCSQTYTTEWPDVSRVLEAPANPTPIPEGLFDAVQDLAPFTDKLERIFLDPSGKLRTSMVEEEGASYELEAIQVEGCYNFRHLLSLQGVANSIDLTLYPSPCIFYGEGVRGALIGLRL